MDDRTPSDSDALGRPQQEMPVPNPHRGEPEPLANEGIRPEADPAVVRPDEDEPTGPLEGLVTAASAETAEEATPDGDPETEALLARMGVEEEGVEAGQLLGLVAATIAAIVALAIVLIFLFYEPFLGDVSADAENVEQYPELAAARIDARAKLEPYARVDSAYSIPITQAMGLVAADYETRGDYSESATAIPASRAEWNTVMVMRGMGRAVQAGTPSGLTRGAMLRDSVATRSATPVVTDEEVGVDELEETIPDDN